VTKLQLSNAGSRLEAALAAILVTTCFITMLVGEPARQWLRYDRSALEAGQWWRIVSAHFVHLGVSHTLLNLAGFGLVAAIFRRDLRVRDWIGAGLSSAAAITAGLYVFSPETDWYVGLSGVLHGWFVIGALRVTESQRGVGMVLVAALAVKLGWEQLVGVMPTTLALDVGPVVVDAHLYGASGAALFYFAARIGALAASAGRSL